MQNQPEVINSLEPTLVKKIVTITLLQHAENDFGTRKQYCQYVQLISENSHFKHTRSELVKSKGTPICSAELDFVGQTYELSVLFHLEDLWHRSYVQNVAEYMY